MLVGNLWIPDSVDDASGLLLRNVIWRGFSETPHSPDWWALVRFSERGPLKEDIAPDAAMTELLVNYHTTIGTKTGEEVTSTVREAGWRYVAWAWRDLKLLQDPQSLSDFYTALRAIGDVRGFVTVSDRLDPFEGLGYKLNLWDYGVRIPGYGWITAVGSRSAVASQRDVHDLEEEGLVWRELSDATLVIELPGGPVCEPVWYDRIDQLVAPIRVERRGSSRGSHTEITTRTLSAADAALCYPGPMQTHHPARHPDPRPFTEASRRRRNEEWPDKHHRPPPAWYREDGV